MSTIHLKDVANHYEGRYPKIFRMLYDHLRPTFYVIVDTSKLDLDIILTDVSLGVYISIVHEDNSTYQVCYRSKDAKYVFKSFSDQLHLIKFIDVLLPEFIRRGGDNCV